MSLKKKLKNLKKVFSTGKKGALLYTLSNKIRLDKSYYTDRTGKKITSIRLDQDSNFYYIVTYITDQGYPETVLVHPELLLNHELELTITKADYIKGLKGR